MYILYARWLTFQADPERHVQGVIVRFRDRRDLLGEVDAVIDGDFNRAVARLVEIVRRHLSTFVDVRDGKVAVSDFTLTYCTSRIVWDELPRASGTAGSPHRVCSELKL